MSRPNKLSTVSCSVPSKQALHCVLFCAVQTSSPLCRVLSRPNKLSTVSCSVPSKQALHCVLFCAVQTSSPLCPVLCRPNKLSTVSCSVPSTQALHCVLFCAVQTSSPLCPVLSRPNKLSTVSCSVPALLFHSRYSPSSLQLHLAARCFLAIHVSSGGPSGVPCLCLSGVTGWGFRVCACLV